MTTDLSALIKANSIGGSQLSDATLGYMWIPVDWDSVRTDGGVAPDTVYGAGAWSFGADNSPDCNYQGTEPAYKVFGFDADQGSTGDDSVWCNFICPSNYKDDTMELYLYGFHLDDDGAYTDSIIIRGSVYALGVLDTTSHLWENGTAMTGYTGILNYTGPGGDATSDSILFRFNLDPEVTNLDAGDLIRVLIYFDETRCDLDTGGSRFYVIGMLVTWDIADVP